jgi:hypothetical protein
MKIFLATIGVLFSISTFAQLPPSAVVTNVQIDGSGCDAGSANAIMTQDLNYLSVLYDRFAAQIGRGTENPNAKAIEKKCTILVDVNVPAGWMFDIDSIEYKGYVEIPNKLAAAYQVATAEIAGGKGSIGFEQKLFNGPKSENYSLLMKNKNILGNSQTLSALACLSSSQNIRIKIKSLIGVRNLLAQIFKPAVKIVVDSTDASFRQNLKLNWRRCQ